MDAYGKYECFVMQLVYVCVLCASCGSPQCCVLHDLQFVYAYGSMCVLDVLVFVCVDAMVMLST